MIIPRNLSRRFVDRDKPTLGTGFPFPTKDFAVDDDMLVVSSGGSGDLMQVMITHMVYRMGWMDYTKDGEEVGY